MITGASSGIGAEFATQLAEEGFSLVIIARRVQKLEQLAEDIRSRHPVQVTVQQADLSQKADIERVVASIQELPNLDLLVNNAGFGTVGRFTRVEAKKELAMMYVHMIAPVVLCRAALPGMLAHKQGAIINVSSLSGIIPIRNVVYQSTKAFLVNFSYALRNELQGSGVRVQALCPGFVYTEFHDTPEYTHFSRNSIPDFLWMEPGQVVSESLKALEHNKFICIPGTINKLAGALSQNSLSAGLIRAAVKLVLRRRRTFINT